MIRRFSYRTVIDQTDLAECGLAKEATMLVQKEMAALRGRALAGGEHSAARMTAREDVFKRRWYLEVTFDSNAWTG